MVWDYAEANTFAADIGGSFRTALEKGAQYNRGVPTEAIPRALAVRKSDASIQRITARKVTSTDPPYYDNIGYADLSDFFYIWLRRSLKSTCPRSVCHARRA